MLKLETCMYSVFDEFVLFDGEGGEEEEKEGGGGGEESRRS